MSRVYSRPSAAFEKIKAWGGDEGGGLVLGETSGSSLYALRFLKRRADSKSIML
jgi:hypothetical protein